MGTADWTVVAAIVAAIFGFLGVRYTARSSKKASETSAMMAAPESIAAGYDKLNDDLWRTVTDLKADVSALKSERTYEYTRYRASIGYIRYLLSLLTLHAPTVTLPHPPAELRDDVRVDRGSDIQ